MRQILLVFILVQTLVSNAQSAWPSESWASAANLTDIMSASGLTELSGLHWNQETNRLYVVHGDGRVRVLEFNTGTNTFAQIGNKTISGGPEGITQASLSANEFYTVDENNYEIRKYTHTTNFSSVTESKHWNLLQSPSPMTDTGNTGPEGITFVPDAALTTAGFTSSETGNTYTSVKGAGGLFFIAHQNGGYVWVFDINPNVNNDFAYVGKYKTSRSESCDLSFDRTTGMLYILHNTGSNYIEVTDLSLAAAPGGEATFTLISEYFVSNPTGNDNIEGFAITPKCPDGTTVSAFLCRDVESGESSAYKLDAIRWFSPFTADGNCSGLANPEFGATKLVVYPNPANNQITISVAYPLQSATLRILNSIGQVVFEKQNCNEKVFTLDVSKMQNGMYFVEISDSQNTSRMRWLKN